MVTLCHKALVCTMPFEGISFMVGKYLTKPSQLYLPITSNNDKISRQGPVYFGTPNEPVVSEFMLKCLER